MTPTQALEHLNGAGGFYGVRVIGTAEKVFVEGDIILIDNNGHERKLTNAAFEAQFTGARFACLATLEAARG